MFSLFPYSTLFRSVPRQGDMLGWLHAYIDMLRLRVDAAAGAAAPFVAGHIRDLIGAVTAVAADDVILEQPGVKAGRLRAIKADIAAQVCDPRLDIAGVAARAGIRPR